MKTKAVVKIYAGVFICAIASAFGQMSLQFNIIGPTDHNIGLERFDAQLHPTFRSEMAGPVGNFRQAAFVLTNSSEKPVTALAVRYVIRDASGGEKGFRFFTDSYGTLGNRAVLRAKGKMLIEPGLFLPEELVGRGRMGTTGLGSKETALISMIATAKAVDAYLDVLAFEDGEILGPNTLQFTQEITGRSVAAKRVAEAARSGSEAGKSIREVMNSLSSSPVRRDDFIGRWIQRYAMQMARQRPGSIDALERLPQPPKFWTK